VLTDGFIFADGASPTSCVVIKVHDLVSASKTFWVDNPKVMPCTVSDGFEFVLFLLRYF